MSERRVVGGWPSTRPRRDLAATCQSWELLTSQP